MQCIENTLVNYTQLFYEHNRQVRDRLANERNKINHSAKEILQ